MPEIDISKPQAHYLEIKKLQKTCSLVVYLGVATALDSNISLGDVLIVNEVWSINPIIRPKAETNHPSFQPPFTDQGQCYKINNSLMAQIKLASPQTSKQFEQCRTVNYKRIYTGLQTNLLGLEFLTSLFAMLFEKVISSGEKVNIIFDTLASIQFPGRYQADQIFEAPNLQNYRVLENPNSSDFEVYETLSDKVSPLLILRGISDLRSPRDQYYHKYIKAIRWSDVLLNTVEVLCSLLDSEVILSAKKIPALSQVSSASSNAMPILSTEIEQHRQSEVVPRLRWLHISGLRFSTVDKHNVRIIRDSLISTIKEFERIDLIFISGDIANNATKAEYSLAEDYLRELCEAANISASRVFMVPGGTDVYHGNDNGLALDLSTHDEISQYFSPKMQRPHANRLKEFIEFHDRFYRTAPESEHQSRQADPTLAVAPAEIVKVLSLNVGILPLNSALFAQAEQERCRGRLFIGEEVVRSGIDKIKDAKLKIAFVNHSLSWLSDLEKKQIYELLTRNCHLVLQGHDCDPRRITNAASNRFIISSGSVYSGRTDAQSLAMLGTLFSQTSDEVCYLEPYPIRYERTGHDRWTIDPSVFPTKAPAYLDQLAIRLL